MEQLKLLDDGPAGHVEPVRAPRARARARDGDGSARAAARMNETGAAASQAARVLDALSARPWSTTSELARGTGLDRVMVARRMADLFHAGRVAKAAAKGREFRFAVVGEQVLELWGYTVEVAR